MFNFVSKDPGKKTISQQNSQQDMSEMENVAAITSHLIGEFNYEYSAGLGIGKVAYIS